MERFHCISYFNTPFLMGTVPSCLVTSGVHLLPVVPAYCRGSSLPSKQIVLYRDNEDSLWTT